MAAASQSMQKSEFRPLSFDKVAEQAASHDSAVDVWRLRAADWRPVLALYAGVPLAELTTARPDGVSRGARRPASGRPAARRRRARAPGASPSRASTRHQRRSHGLRPGRRLCRKAAAGTPTSASIARLLPSDDTLTAIRNTVILPWNAFCRQSAMDPNGDDCLPRVRHRRIQAARSPGIAHPMPGCAHSMGDPPRVPGWCRPCDRHRDTGSRWRRVRPSAQRDSRRAGSDPDRRSRPAAATRPSTPRRSRYSGSANTARHTRGWRSRTHAAGRSSWRT